MEQQENNQQSQIAENDFSTSVKFYLAKAKTKSIDWYKRQTGLWWKVPVVLGATGALSIVLLVLLIRFGAFGSLPAAADLKGIRNHNAAEVYSEDDVLLGKYFVENRTNVSHEDISSNITNALVATEDARFFEHGGVDMRAWVRVLVRTIIMRDRSGGGGSTLSQQLAKNLYPRRAYPFLTVPITKIKEMFIARRLEKIYSKEELLAMYLNTVPFGRNIFGVEVAAKQFFQTNATDIKQEQAAVLVGMLKANTGYDPVRNPERSKKRRNVVLTQMKKYNYLDTETCDSLKAMPLEVNYKRESNTEGLGTYFREHIRLELEEKLSEYTKPDGSEYNLYTDGLKIYTTINSKMQSYAEQAVSEVLKGLQKDFDKHWKGRKVWGSDKTLEELKKKTDRYKKMKAAGATKKQIDEAFIQVLPMTVFSWDGKEEKKMSPLDSIKYYYAMLNAGFMVMHPQTGEIKAWVGGIDHAYFQYDHVKSKRQVGSTFKPVVYTRALEAGIHPCDYIDNRLVIFTDYDDWKPENSDGHYGGVYSMQGGLTKSVNTISVDLVMRSGIDSTRLLAHNLGVNTDVPDGPAIALGAVDISLYDMMKVYGTFANRGRRPDPIYITRIETANGETIAEYENKPSAFRQVISQDNADIMVEMMQSVVDSGTARRLRYLYKLPNDIAGKTGTTQSHADGWFMGFTPNLVAGAWVGGEYPSVRFRSLRQGQGANTALPIWARFMQKVNKDPSFRKMQNIQFAEPSPYVEELLDCMPYLEERPLFVEDIFQDVDEGLEEGIEKLLDVFRRERSQNDDPRINERPGDRTPRKPRVRKESEERRRAKEKAKKKKERKKKRKEFFDKVFKND